MRGVPDEDEDIFVHLGLFAFLWGVKSKKSRFKK